MLNGGEGADTLSGGNGDDELIGGAGADSISGGAGNDTLKGEAGNDKLSGGDGEDTLIGGMGNDKFTGGAGKDVFVFSGGTFFIVNQNVILAYGKSSLTVVDGAEKEINFADGTTAVYEVGKFNSAGTSITLAAETKSFAAENYSDLVTIDGAEAGSTLKITGNAQDNYLVGGAKNDTLSGGGGNDTLSGGIGNDKLTGGTGGDLFIFSSGSDTITDYEAGEDKISVSGISDSFSIVNQNLVLGYGKSSLTIVDGAGKEITFADGSTAVYEAGKFNSAGTSITLGAETKSFNAGNYSELETVDGGETNGALKVAGNAKNNYIVGGAGNDSLAGGAGDDTLIGGTGNDKLTGGKGADLFIFSGGKDTITDYAADEDRISVSASDGFALVDKNVVLSYGGNSLTLVNALDKEINFADGSTSIFAAGNFNEAGTAITLGAETKSFSATVYSDIVKINSAEADGTLKITGNAKNNYLVGGENNDTLSGGDGDDTLYGGAGEDVFIYKPGEGTDKIFDYESGELISLGGSFSDAVFDKNTLTLAGNGGGTLILNKVTASTEFNINNTTYHVSGKTLTE